MQVRRLVTTTDSGGRAVFAHTGDAPHSSDSVHTPGFGIAALWQTPADPTLPENGEDRGADIGSYMPAPGGTVFTVLRLPPLSVMQQPDFDPAAAGEEQMRLCPGIAEHFERDHPGMHTTNTIDYGVVLDGEVWLELDDERRELLRAGDTFVQNGTRHAWRNLGDRPVTLAIVAVGAIRAAG